MCEQCSLLAHFYFRKVSMTSKYIISIILFIVWFYVLTVFKRVKQDFFFFIFGSVGAFLFLYTYILPAIQGPVIYAVTYLAGKIGEFTNTYGYNAEYGIIKLSNDGFPVNMYLNMECSGVLEIITYFSMICFYPAYRIVERAVLCLSGISFIIVANVIRLMSIGLLVNNGITSFYTAHVIIGRFIFYVLMIIMYFYVFTKRQIVKQKVGEFNYD